MLDEIAVVADDAGNKNLAVGKFDFFPDTPLVIVAGIGRLNGISAGAHLEDQIGDIL